MRKVDFTDLADYVSEAKDLIDPEVQTTHPAMQELFEILAYNLMDDDERAIHDQHVYTGGPVDAKRAFQAFGEQGGANHTPEEILDTLYTGLMDEQRYEDFKSEQQANPRLTARDYYNSYIKQYAGPGMNKLAAVFDAFMNEKPAEKPVKFISREEFRAMKPEDRTKNYDRAVKSMKKW